MGKYLEPYWGKYYLRTDELSAKEERAYLRANHGTNISQLADFFEDLENERAGAFFIVGLLTGCAIGFFGCLVWIWSYPAALVVFYIALGLGSLIGVGGPLLIGLGKLWSAIASNRFIHPTSHWIQQFEASPNVVKLDGDQARPAVKALGSPNWFSRNARHGDAINAYLDNPSVQEVEHRLGALGDDVESEVQRQADGVLSRLADGYVFSSVKEIERVEEDKKEADAMLAKQRKAELNQAVRRDLEELASSIVTPDEVHKELR